ncbi:MAG: dockerin type I repeat-containing protein [Planctomycetota bacterium]
MPGAKLRCGATRPSRGSVLCGLLLGLLSLGSVAHPAHAADPGVVTGFTLEIGDAIGFPNQAFLSVPVFMTNSSDVTSWEMGLDYDEFMLQMVAVVFTGTESENLGPSVTSTPQNPPIHWFRVQYSTAQPLPAGPRRIVAYLVFHVSGTPAATTEYSIDVLSDSLVNNNQIPVTIDGSLTLIIGDLLRIGQVAGNLLGQPGGGGGSFSLPGAGPPPFVPMRIPVRVWNESEIHTLMLGVSVSEELWFGVDFADTAVFAATGGDIEVVLADTVAGKLVSLDLNGNSLPPGSGQVVAWLLIAPLEPVAGRYPLVPSPPLTLFDGLAVPNLLSGSAEFVAEFVRGDASFDGQVNIADAARILEFLFQAASLPCREAADGNDDGAVDVADTVFVLNYLFANGPQPPLPFPAPAVDLDPNDELPCLGF